MGTVEGERGSWRQITSESLQAKAEPSVSVGFSRTVILSFHISPISIIRSLFVSVSKSLSLFLCFSEMTEAAGAWEFGPVTLPLPITSLSPSLFPSNGT